MGTKIFVGYLTTGVWRVLCALLVLLAGLAQAADAEDCQNHFEQGRHERAIVSCERAAQQGDAEAQFILGWLYAFGVGVEQDLREGAKWTLASAKQGYIEAQYSMYRSYRDGYGIAGSGVAKDYQEAAKWLRRAAQQGNAVSQYELGGLYRKGEGVPRDDKQAAKWWLAAAKQGLANAQYELGRLYRKGEGVSRDYATAIKWINKAAEQGDPYAQYELGLMHHLGEGVPQDDKEAYILLTMAMSEFKFEGDKRRVAMVAKNLTAKEISDAKRIAKERLQAKSE